MAVDKQRVLIKLESQIDLETHLHEYEGTSYVHNGTLYVQYESTDEMNGSVRTILTVHVHDQSIRLRRYGGIESDQSFQTGQSTPGEYRSMFTQFTFNTVTHRVEATHQKIEWVYQLLISGEASGMFQMTMTLHPIQEGN